MVIDKNAIRRRALGLISGDGHRVATQLAAEFGLSRQCATGYLQAMLKQGLIEAEGSTQARVYRLCTFAEKSLAYPRDGLQEDGEWRIGSSGSSRWFRVFATAHPEVRLTPVNTSEAVASMVRRVMSRGARSS